MALAAGVSASEFDNDPSEGEAEAEIGDAWLIPDLNPRTTNRRWGRWWRLAATPP